MPTVPASPGTGLVLMPTRQWARFPHYPDQQGAPESSDVETFCALRLFIDSNHHG
jgi:glucose-6-phosphate 1-dehydrogenase